MLFETKSEVDIHEMSPAGAGLCGRCGAGTAGSRPPGGHDPPAAQPPAHGRDPLRQRPRARIWSWTVIEPMLTDAEAAVLRRGKNASKATVAKHATVQEYRASTGFECLLGWLYLQGKQRPHPRACSMPCGKGTSRSKADTPSPVGADARHRPVRQPLSCGAMQVSPPAYCTAESLGVPAGSRRGPASLAVLAVGGIGGTGGIGGIGGAVRGLLLGAVGRFLGAVASAVGRVVCLILCHRWYDSFLKFASKKRYCRFWTAKVVCPPMAFLCKGETVMQFPAGFYRAGASTAWAPRFDGAVRLRHAAACPRGNGQRVCAARRSGSPPMRISPLRCRRSAPRPLPPRRTSSPGRHPWHHAGVFYAQEPSASAPAALLDVHPGMKVADLCAAPGRQDQPAGGGFAGAGLAVGQRVCGCPCRDPAPKSGAHGCDQRRHHQ